MSANWQAYQPNYFDELRLIAREQVLKERIEKALNEKPLNLEGNGHKKNARKYLVLNHQFKSRLFQCKTRLRFHRQKISGYEWQFQSRKPLYDGYLQDVHENIERLDEAYEALLDKLRAIELPLDLPPATAGGAQTAGSGNLPTGRVIFKQWESILDAADDYQPFVPVASPAAFVATYEQKGKGGQIEIAQPPWYPMVRIKYADNGELAADRYALHWLYEKNSDRIASSDYQDTMMAFAMSPIGYGQSSSYGYFKKAPVVVRNIHVESLQFESRWRQDQNPSLDEVIAQKMDRVNIKEEEINRANREAYGPEKPWACRHANQEKEFQIYALASLDNFDPILKRGFMLYPLDWGPFKTKPLTDLSNFTFPDYIQGGPLVNQTHLNGNRYEIDIELYCTLPEWNARLQDKVKILETAIGRDKLVKLPHQRNLYLLSSLHELLELQMNHSRHAVSAAQMQIRKDLEQAIDELYDGIGVQLDYPTDDAPNDFYWVAHTQQDLDQAAEDLWELLSSKAFIDEIRHYLEYVGDNQIKDGKYPPGPYMEYEPCWNEIFRTIARCYAALSHSEKVAKKVWEEDIIHGLEQVAELQEVKDQLGDVAEAWVEAAGDLHITVRDTVNGQQIADLKKIRDRKESPSSLLSTIISHFAVATEPFASVKPILDQVVPVPGPPCLLQVVLQNFNNRFTHFLLGKLRSDDVTFHIRFFAGYLSVHKISVKHGTITIKQFNAIYGSLAVRLASKGRFPLVNEGKRVLHGLFSGLSKGDAEGAFYSKFENPYGAAAKGVFVLLNITLMLQGMEAIRNGRNFSELDGLDAARMIETFASLAVGVGSLSVSSAKLLSGLRRFQGRATSFKGFIGKTSIGLDRVAVVLGYYSAVISIYEAIGYAERGEKGKAAKALISATGMITLSTGYILRKRIIGRAVGMAARFLGREAAVVVGSAEGGPLAPALMVIGSVINTGLLIWDSPEILNGIASLFDSSATKNAHAIWLNLTAPLDENDELYRLYAELEAFHRANPTKGLSLVDLNALFKEAGARPFDNYVSEHLPEKYQQLTRYPADKIEVLHYDEVIEIRPNNSYRKLDARGVKWGPLTWRAVIPLHNLGYSVSEIEKLVELGDIEKDIRERLQEKFGAKQPDDSIRTVQDIVGYYEEVCELTPDQGYDRETLAKTIAQLSQGTFVANPSQGHYQVERWQHPAFRHTPGSQGAGAAVFAATL